METGGGEGPASRPLMGSPWGAVTLLLVKSLAISPISAKILAVSQQYQMITSDRGSERLDLQKSREFSISFLSCDTMTQAVIRTELSFFGAVIR